MVAAMTNMLNIVIHNKQPQIPIDKHNKDLFIVSAVFAAGAGNFPEQSISSDLAVADNPNPQPRERSGKAELSQTEVC